MRNKFAPSALKVSAPGKIHLLGEHAVVYGKPALLTAIDLRVTVSISPAKKFSGNSVFKRIIEPIVKKKFNLQKIPSYKLEVNSQIPLGCGLGSSAAISAAYIGTLLSFLRIKWDKTLINKLTFVAEKVFHGNPSGGDNSTVVYGGLVWFPIKKLDFTIPGKLARNFVLINTGKPNETTKHMIEIVAAHKDKFQKIFDDQERLVKELLPVLKNGNEQEFIRIIREGEKNLESIGVVSIFVKSIIRQIEKAGGAAKICGAGGKTRATGILLCYHPNPSVINNLAKSYGLDYFKTALGVEGLKNEA